jgi:hypothetical protein
VLLGNASFWLGRKLVWNVEELRVENAPEAAALIDPLRRDGWEA